MDALLAFAGSNAGFVIVILYIRLVEYKRGRRESKQDQKINAIAKHLGVDFESGMHTVVRHPGVSTRVRKAN